ncbi:MAG: TonB-dependent receptor plug domain-containing protein, partial [Ginsengibacter sp.]
MNVIKQIVTLFVSLILFLSSFAQDRTLTGTVSSAEDNSPLVGVTVTVSQTNKSTITNSSGNYSIKANKGQTLQFTYVGYESISRVIGNADLVSVSLSVSAKNKLQDVVIVGYGTQKRVNLTGAVSTVDVDKVLGSRPITDVARGLQGAVPGLTITTPNGEIGTNPTIRLRGVTGSLNAPGGAQPLILVDNVELPDLNLINPQDIESVSVLKDAASTSIYGSRAAWGVVLI